MLLDLCLEVCADAFAALDFNAFDALVVPFVPPFSPPFPSLLSTSLSPSDTPAVFEEASLEKCSAVVFLRWLLCLRMLLVLITTDLNAGDPSDLTNSADRLLCIFPSFALFISSAFDSSLSSLSSPSAAAVPDAEAAIECLLFCGDSDILRCT